MSDKINVLLTSFEQFYKYKYNPTISVSEKIENILTNSNIINLSTKVMQCKYSTIKEEVYDLYKSFLLNVSGNPWLPQALVYLLQ